MTRFFFIRHGKKQNRIGDPFLEQLGVEQAAQTADFFKDKNIVAIYASPLNRTIQTAQIIADSLQLPISTDERLRERMNWGDDPNETFDEFLQHWNEGELDRHLNPANGVSSFDSGKRVAALIDELAIKNPNKNILLVTHGGAIGDVLKNIFPSQKLPLVKNVASSAEYIDIKECSITILEKNQDNFELIQIADVAHLQQVN